MYSRKSSLFYAFLFFANNNSQSIISWLNVSHEDTLQTNEQSEFKYVLIRKSRKFDQKVANDCWAMTSHDEMKFRARIEDGIFATNVTRRTMGYLQTFK